MYASAVLPLLPGPAAAELFELWPRMQEEAGSSAWEQHMEPLLRDVVLVLQALRSVPADLVAVAPSGVVATGGRAGDLRLWHYDGWTLSPLVSQIGRAHV